MGCHLGMNQHPCDHRMKPVPGCQVPCPLTCKLSKEQSERHRGQQSSNLVNSLIYTSFADRSHLGRFRTHCQETCAHTWAPVFHWFESVYSVHAGQHKPSKSTIPPCPMACWEVVGGGDKGGILVRAGQGTSSAARRLVNGIHGGSLLPSNSQAWLENSF